MWRKSFDEWKKKAEDYLASDDFKELQDTAKKIAQETTQQLKTSAQKMTTDLEKFFAGSDEQEQGEETLDQNMPPATWVRILPDKRMKWSAAQTSSFIRALLAQHKTGFLELSIVATATECWWSIANNGIAPISPQQIMDALQSYYPDAAISADDIPAVEYPIYRSFMALAPQFFKGVNFEWSTEVDEIKGSEDPLMWVARAMSNLRVGETLEYRLQAAPPRLLSEKEIKKMLTTSAVNAGYRPGSGRIITRSTGHLVGSLFGSGLRYAYDYFKLKNTLVSVFSDADTIRYLQKLTQPFSPVVMSLTLESPDPNRTSVLTNISAAIGRMRSEHVGIMEKYRAENRLAQDPDSRFQNEWGGYYTSQPKGADANGEITFNLTPDELAVFWHLPHAEYDTPDNTFVWANPLPPELLDVPEGEGVDLAIADATGEQVMRIRDVDRAYHTFVSGKPGMGKSTLLLNWICSDIRAGHGVAVLDPHGKLIDDVLSSGVTEGREDDVVFLDCGDKEYPAPLNPFRVSAGGSIEEVPNIILWILKSIFKDSWSEGRMQALLKNTLQLALLETDPTPLDIQRILISEKYRNRLLQKLKETGGLSINTRNYWKIMFAEESAGAQRGMRQPVLNRLDTLLSTPLLEMMTCHPDGLDYQQLIRDKKIVLIDLSGKNIRDELGTLGTILLAQFFLASLGLGALPQGKPPRFFLYTDETHTLVNSTIPTLFSEARKFGLALILADQWLGQLDEEVRAGIVNTRGTTITYKLEGMEAEQTAKLFEPEVNAGDILRQDVGVASVLTTSRGNSLPAFQIKTLPPMGAQLGKRAVTSIKSRSRRNMRLKTAAQVRAWLDERYTDDEDTASGGIGRDLQDFEPKV